jgi:hypothetical protein
MKATDGVEGNVLPFDDDAAILDGFEDKIIVRSADMEVDSSDDDDTHLGGQSQAAMKLLDEADPISDDDEKDIPNGRISRLEVKPISSGVTKQYGVSSGAASQYAILNLCAAPNQPKRTITRSSTRYSHWENYHSLRRRFPVPLRRRLRLVVWLAMSC